MGTFSVFLNGREREREREGERDFSLSLLTRKIILQDRGPTHTASFNSNYSLIGLISKCNHEFLENTIQPIVLLFF